MSLSELSEIYITLLKIRGELRHHVDTQKSLCNVRDAIARKLHSPQEVVQNVYEAEVLEELRKANQ